MPEDGSSAIYEHGNGLPQIPTGSKIRPGETHKRINDASDLMFWHSSKAFADLTAFLGQLNRSMMPVRLENDEVRQWQTRSVHITQSPQVIKVKVLLQTLGSIIEEAPPETGPRRFGNLAFRKWHEIATAKAPALLQQALSEEVWHYVDPADRDGLTVELGDYLLASFGSAERLDYGTGHELSFIGFLCCLWKLHGFAPSEGGNEERGIVVGLIEPYFELVRQLIRVYNLEPAGSHGVWGLDDHAFVPYIFGSAQLAPPLLPHSPVPVEGSLTDAPAPSVVVKESQVRSLSSDNLYFAAVTFIYDVKKGPFWEHSPILYDISGLTKGWAKVNKGLLKMYQAEVLAKFPVVQHLRFGSLLMWEEDPHAVPMMPSVHARSQPTIMQPPPSLSNGKSTPGPSSTVLPPAMNSAGTAAPWARQTTFPVASSFRQPLATRHGPGSSSTPPVPRFRGLDGTNGS